MGSLLRGPLWFDGPRWLPCLQGFFGLRTPVEALLRGPHWLCSRLRALVRFSWVTCRSAPWLVARYVDDGRDGCFASGAAMGALLQQSFYLGGRDGCFASMAAMDGRPRGPLWYGGLD